MIDITSVTAFVGIVTLIVLSPGPNLFLLLKNVPVAGRKSGIMIVLGICCAILMHVFMSLIGVSAVIMTSAALFSIMKFVGAAYLIWLGIKALQSAKQGAKFNNKNFPQLM